MTATLDKIDGLSDAEPAPALAKKLKAARPKRTPLWRLLDWRVALGGLLVGGLVHIGMVMTATLNPQGSAFKRIREQLPVNRAQTLPAPIPGKQPLPYMVPDALYVLCRYDLSVDSLRISTSLMERGWTLSLHTAMGDNYYVMPGQAKRTDVSFVIFPGTGSMETGPAPRRFGSGDVQITSPTLEGLVVVRAPLKGIAYRAETEAALAFTSCSPVKR